MFLYILLKCVQQGYKINFIVLNIDASIFSNFLILPSTDKIRRSMRDSGVTSDAPSIHLSIQPSNHPSIHPRVISRYPFVVRNRRMCVLSAYQSSIEEGQDSIKKSATWTKSGSFLSPEKHSPCIRISRFALDFNVRAVFFSPWSPFPLPYIHRVIPSLLRGALRCVACERAGPAVRAPASLDGAQRRGDRDAKGTRAAFKLAAAKRINSPGSLDLLIRAAVAFLRGLDR